MKIDILVKPIELVSPDYYPSVIEASQLVSTDYYPSVIETSQLCALPNDIMNS